MEKKIEIKHLKQIELVAESLARILIQQVVGRKNHPTDIYIQTKHEKTN